MSRIQLRRGTAERWTSTNPTLAPGEPGFELDTGKCKIGDGSSRWNSLPYFDQGAIAASLAAGDNVTLEVDEDTNTVTISSAIYTNDEALAVIESARLLPLETQSGDFALSDNDAWAIIETTNASDAVCTIPAGLTSPANTQWRIDQMGLGRISLVAGSASVILRDPNSAYFTAQYRSVTIRKRATDDYVISGTLGTVPTAPGTPTGLLATAGDTKVSLTWNPTINVSGYRIYRNAASAAVYDGVSTSFTDVGLTNGTPYGYTVSAYNTVGESAKSASAGATPTASGGIVLWNGDFSTNDFSQYGTPQNTAYDGGVSWGSHTTNVIQASTRRAGVAYEMVSTVYGDTTNGLSGPRAELPGPTVFAENDDVYFGFSLWVPVSNANTWAGGQHDVFQLKNFEPPSGAGPVLFDIRHWGPGNPSNGLCVMFDSTVILLIPEANLYDTLFDFCVHCKFSANAGLGQIEIWINGVKNAAVGTRTMATLRSGANSYMKIGLYGPSPLGDVTHSVQHSAVAMGTTRAAVDPSIRSFAPPPDPGFPTTPVLDTFTRADGAIGANWTAGFYDATDPMEVFSNALQVNQTHGVGDSRWGAATYGPDVEAYMTISSLQAQENDLYVVDGSGHGYEVDRVGTTVLLYKMTGGGGTSQIGTTVTGVNWASGDKLGIRRKGTAFEAWRCPAGGTWTLLESVTDSTYTLSGAKIGMYNGGLSTRIDNFGGGTAA